MFPGRWSGEEMIITLFQIPQDLLQLKWERLRGQSWPDTVTRTKWYTWHRVDARSHLHVRQKNCCGDNDENKTHKLSRLKITLHIAFAMFSPWNWLRPKKDYSLCNLGTTCTHTHMRWVFCVREIQQNWKFIFLKKLGIKNMWGALQCVLYLEENIAKSMCTNNNTSAHTHTQ